MTEVLKRGPGRPPNVAAPVVDAAVASEATPVAPVEAAKPKTIEVRIMRKYCPEFIIEEDGTARKNGESGHFEYIVPETTPKLNEQGKVTNDLIILGTVAKLLTKEAHRVLHLNGIAVPTSQTYRDDE
jgi:hypothetical protein